MLFEDPILLAFKVVIILAIFGGVLGGVPFMVLLERKLIARIQQRSGPNRVGPWGLLQTIVDGIKLFLKEDTYPDTIEKPLHRLAPLMTVIPAILVLSILPIAPAFTVSAFGWEGTIPVGITDLEVGLLVYLALTGVAVYGIVLAGWASNSKYSLLGGVRSSAQVLSYELALGLSLIGILMICRTFEMRSFIEQQAGGFWNWNLVKQPVGFLVFLVAGFAETNRLPFDLPEGESELGGGFHTEYSSMKFAMFFMAEYMNMFTFAAIMTTLFLGGFQGPVALPFLEPLMQGTLALPFGIEVAGLAGVLVGLFWFSVKVVLIISFMIFIRGTWPRFRYDQLMDLGWKVMLPLALVNVIVTAFVMMFAPAVEGVPTQPLGWGPTLALFLAGAATLVVFDRIMTARRKRILSHVS